MAVRVNTDHIESQAGSVFLERMPDSLYQELVKLLTKQYHFANGVENHGKMRLAEYFVGIRQSVANNFFRLIRQVLANARLQLYPYNALYEGFSPVYENLVPLEQQNGFSFCCFDAAVHEDGLKIIELQAYPSYHVTAAKLSTIIKDTLIIPYSSVFLGDTSKTSWKDFINLKQDILANGASDGIVITDRELATQKTNFEFYATQTELEINIDIVDSKAIFEKNRSLYYPLPRTKSVYKPLHRLYNRVLVLEAIIDDNYPLNTKKWRFRFDKPYRDMKFINHPSKPIQFSKAILPYLTDDFDFNVECYELADVFQYFNTGELCFSEYVWKHKMGVAGRNNILFPNQEILRELTQQNVLTDYIAQRKIEFERFNTQDNQEKIIELRFMCVQSLNQLMVIPMARLGHLHKTAMGLLEPKIHFSDNNFPSYGFCPVIIVGD